MVVDSRVLAEKAVGVRDGVGGVGGGWDAVFGIGLWSADEAFDAGDFVDGVELEDEGEVGWGGRNF